MENTGTRSSVRLLLAAVLVVAGLVTIAPSFEPDSDGDGVADVTEIHNLNTDPSKADAFKGSFVANR